MCLGSLSRTNEYPIDSVCLCDLITLCQWLQHKHPATYLKAVTDLVLLSRGQVMLLSPTCAQIFWKEDQHTVRKMQFLQHNAYIL